MYNIDEREQQVNEQEGKNETKETVEESLWVEGQEAGPRDNEQLF